jgi:hypothetical protein
VNSAKDDMARMIKRLILRAFRKMGFDIVRGYSPLTYFHKDGYLRKNSRMLEHLATLRIPISGMSVLEVGAGVGDHSHYYIDRDCRITITDVRPENLDYLRKRYPQGNIQFLNMDNPAPIEGSPFDIVHCYGLLYHLSDPEKALEFLSKNCSRMIFLETRVMFGEKEELSFFPENRLRPIASYSGTGCIPTRLWVYKKIKTLYEYVYLPKTQPNQKDYPLDWTAPDKHQSPRARAVFIGSREKIENELLTTALIDKQIRHE